MAGGTLKQARKKLSALMFGMILGVTVLVGTAVETQGQESSLQIHLRQGLLFIQGDDWDNAAETWEAAALAQANRKGAEHMRTAGFLFTLSSIAYVQLKDGQAYRVWADAVRHYLQGGTTWEQEKRELKRRIEETRFLLRGSVSTEGAGSAFSESDYLLVTLDELSGLLKYDGPPPGLQVRSKDAARSITVSRNFYARPTIVIEQDDEEDDGRSRYAVSRDEKEIGKTPTGTVEGLLGRGVIPQATNSNAPDATPEPAQARTSLGQFSLKRSFSPTIAAPAGREEARPRSGNVITRGFRVVVPRSGAPADQSESNARADRSVADTAPVVPVEQAELGKQVLVSEAGPLTEHRGRMPIDESSAPGGSSDDRVDPAPALKLGSIASGELPGLTSQQLEVARRAWQYFVTNRRQNTGLFNSVKDYPYSTLWDLGASLGAVVSAERLGFLSRSKFNDWMGRLLDSTEAFPLYNNELPNREYDVRSGKMTDLRNRTSMKGSGWSALDIGRTLVWLRILYNWYPEYRDQTARIVAGWDMTRLAQNGELYRMLLRQGREDLKQEGRLGYEHYAAAGFAAWGKILPNSFDLDDVVEIEVNGVVIPFDPRQPTFLTSEPFYLMRLELADQPDAIREISDRIYTIQKQRWLASEIPTAYSEDAIDRKPWFLYNVITDGVAAWRCMTHRSKIQSNCQAISTKTAMAWHALYDDNYTSVLFDSLVEHYHPRFGYFAGIFENGDVNRSLNVNTNAVILEAMLYIARGHKPLLEQELNFEIPHASRSGQ